MKKRTFARGCAILAVLALGAGTAMASEGRETPPPGRRRRSCGGAGEAYAGIEGRGRRGRSGR